MSDAVDSPTAESPAELASCIYQGVVAHHRLRPKRHRFVYRVFSLLLDLDELESLSRQSRWFSLNTFNLLSFHERDHGRGTGNLRAHISQLLQQSGYSQACHSIRLLCYPRMLGYVFNPLSVYFCYDAEQQLRVVIYEVTNTFKERHSYLLPVEDNARLVRHHCQKQMYVSPFTSMQSEYSFRIRPPAQQLNISIRQTQTRDTTAEAADATANEPEYPPLLYAVLSGERRPLTDAQLLKQMLRHPLMTLKVISGIHWEALRLWLKGNPVYPHTPTSAYSLSWQDKTGVFHHEVL